MINASKKQKLYAVVIIAALSTGCGAISSYFLSLFRNDIIQRENLGDILGQIEKANIDTRALGSVLQEPPPLIFLFVATLVGTAIAVWLYHKILGYLCKPNEKENNPNQFLHGTSQ